MVRLKRIYSQIENNMQRAMAERGCTNWACVTEAEGLGSATGGGVPDGRRRLYLTDRSRENARLIVSNNINTGRFETDCGYKGGYNYKGEGPFYLNPGKYQSPNSFYGKDIGIAANPAAEIPRQRMAL